jgi:hypothetical protein
VIWSGYKGGQGKTANLSGVGPGIMLTPQLTGCTVVCKSGLDGTANFSHYNLKNQNSLETLDDDSMRAVAGAQYGGGHSTLTKGDYRGRAKHAGASVTVNVVGHRDHGNWKFWAQYVEYKTSGDQIRHVELLNN